MERLSDARLQVLSNTEPRVLFATETNSMASELLEARERIAKLEAALKQIASGSLSYDECCTLAQTLVERRSS